MRASLVLSVLSLSGLSLACGATGSAPGDPPGARVAIAVAPLSLDGIVDATYTLRVLNGADEVVWSRQVTSTAFGDGAGSVSYVGPCDASLPANTVQVVLDALVDASGPLVEGVDFINPAPTSAPLARAVTCLPDADVQVTFDVTFARAATQGFFDVAVQLDDLYCSAKLDCLDDQGQPLELLHNATSGRAPTAVVAFACTGGAASDTHLYLTDLTVDCGGGDVVTVDPSLGPGRLSAVFGSNLPNAHLFDALVTRGEEQLGTYDKLYWNVALGLEDVVGCTLTARATASDGGFGGLSTPADAIWPYVAFDQRLDTCTRHALDAGDGAVATRYTGFSGATFDHFYNGMTIGVVGAGSFAAPATFADGYTPASCRGYRFPPDPYVFDGPAAGFYVIDPLGDGATVAAYCDMTTDGGGWTRIVGYTGTSTTTGFTNNPGADLQAGLASAATAGGHTSPTALRTWYLAGGFSSMRWECEKESVGRKVHVKTDAPAVIDYFTQPGAAVYPTTSGTVTVMPDDTSALGGKLSLQANGGPASGSWFSGPADWGYTASNTFYTGTWGHVWFAGMDLLTYGPFFIAYTTHFHLNGPRMECDDFEPDPATATYVGYWYTWVR